MVDQALNCADSNGSPRPRGRNAPAMDVAVGAVDGHFDCLGRVESKTDVSGQQLHQGPSTDRSDRWVPSCQLADDPHASSQAEIGVRYRRRGGGADFRPERHVVAGPARGALAGVHHRRTAPVPATDPTGPGCSCSGRRTHTRPTHVLRRRTRDNRVRPKDGTATGDVVRPGLDGRSFDKPGVQFAFDEAATRCRRHLPAGTGWTRRS